MINNMKQLYYLPNDIKFIKNDNNFLLFLNDKKIQINFLKKINYNFDETKNLFIFKNNNCHFLKKILDKKIKGLRHGFKIELQLIGIGYKGQYQLENKLLKLRIGFSHEVNIQIPNEIEIFVENEKTIICYSLDYELLTNFCAKLINLRPINVFTGQGIKKKDDFILIRKNKKK